MTACLSFQTTLLPGDSVTPVKVFLKNAEGAAVFDGTTVIQVTDPDYPEETVYGVVCLDQTTYVMNIYGQIYGSDVGDPFSWSPLNVINANSVADYSVALVRQLNYLVAFGQYSTEFFYNAGNPTGSPLSKVLNALLAMGCASAGSIALADNTIYFMGATEQHGRTIQKMEGYTPKYISNQYIDRVLNSDNLEEVFSFVVKSNGHFFYVLVLVGSNTTFVYDEVTSEWHIWTNMVADSELSASSAELQSDGSILVSMPFPHEQQDGNPFFIANISPAAAAGRFNLRYDSEAMSTNEFSYYPSSPVDSIVAEGPEVTFYTEGVFPGIYYARGLSGDLLLDKLEGSIYVFDPDTYDDIECPINMLMQSALFDFGEMAVKRFNRFELVGDKVFANIYVRYTDDDYDHWSLYRQIRMNVNRAKISNLGSGRRRAFNIKCTDDQPIRLLAAEVDVDKGVF